VFPQWIDETYEDFTPTYTPEDEDFYYNPDNSIYEPESYYYNYYSEPQESLNLAPITDDIISASSTELTKGNTSPIIMEDSPIELTNAKSPVVENETTVEESIEKLNTPTTMIVSQKESSEAFPETSPEKLCCPNTTATAITNPILETQSNRSTLPTPPQTDCLSKSMQIVNSSTVDVLPPMEKKPSQLRVQICPDEPSLSCTTGNANTTVDMDGCLFGLTTESVPDSPSSPDSLNTNQSMAGSDAAPGADGLSESEAIMVVMNRTTSIDDVDEELPLEEEEKLASSLMMTTVDCGNQKEHTKEHGANEVDKTMINDTKMVQDLQSQSEYIPCTTENKAEDNPSTLSSDHDKDEEKSLTTAVSEWLKTQGESALISSTVCLDDDSTSSSCDEDDEQEENNKSNVLNQKNVVGNPWVAPSNNSPAKKTGRKIVRRSLRLSDGVDSRVALNKAGDQKLHSLMDNDNDDSGLELSSPESCCGGEKTEKNKNVTSSTIARDYNCCDPQKFSKYYQLGVVCDSNVVVVKDSCDWNDQELSVHDDESNSIDERNKISTKLGAHGVGTNHHVVPDGAKNNVSSRKDSGIMETSSHLYVNPVSLAEEMMMIGNNKNGGNGDDNSIKCEEFWDLDEDSESLPTYESLPAPQIPIFRADNAAVKVIRRKLHGAEDVTPVAVCCVIQ